MSTSAERAKKLIELFSSIKPYDQILEEIKLDSDDILGVPKIPGAMSWTKDAQEDRIQFLKDKTGKDMPYLIGEKIFNEPESLRGNIEQYIGMTQIPTGIIGPLHIHGTLAQGDFYVPLATSEGALVASYNRGARATRMCGGIVSICLTESVQRAPVFKFKSLSEEGKFLAWILDKMEIFQEIVSKTSRYAKLHDMKINMEGNTCVLI
ncbi:MAG: 3-hydroxy-3-methylglutaryl-CoA reductase, partial [Fimbriimonadaceae bacterium]|nr:3-hydroxy-3-methylglutaryl-CoA reductase [Chitinophagales bacterium]